MILANWNSNSLSPFRGDRLIHKIQMERKALNAH